MSGGQVDAAAGTTSVTDALGGARGVLESSLPAVVFVVAYTASGSDVQLAALVSVAFGVVLTAVRLARRETLQFALSGLAGIALAAFVASRTGRAEDFFLPGLLINVAYAAAWLVSILVRWPLLGVLLNLIAQNGTAWRQDPDQLRVYRQASWIWVGVFVLRLVVQVPLYAAGAVVALGVTRVAMGFPLFLIAGWLSYLLLRRAGLVPGPRTPAEQPD
jgi:hypothetical protein